MKAILLLTDYSKASCNAIDYALQLFKDDTCIFYVHHVKKASGYTSANLMPASNLSLYDSMIKTEMGKIESELKGLTQDYKNKNHHFEISVDYDAFIDSVNQVIKHKNIDLVVLGSNGASDTKEIVFGSNTINVIRKVNCLTLVIPNTFSYQDPNVILLPIEDSAIAKNSSFLKFLDFRKRFGHMLHVLNITTAPLDAYEKQGIINTLGGSKIEYHDIQNVPMVYSITNYVQTHNIDLIALIAKEESFLDRLFFGSSVTELNKNLHLPLMVMHA